MERNIQMIVAYDGTDFHGWQRQGELRTVQAHLEKVTGRVVRHPVQLVASGRTDAGVHAAGQVVNFYSSGDVPPDKVCYAVAARLDPDVVVLQAREVPRGFHATRSASSKLYRYRIHNARRRPVHLQTHRYVYHHYKPLDVAAMRQAAACLVGTHDFRALASSRGAEKRSTVRTILSLDVYAVGEEIRIDVRGDGFLYNQVRNIAGTLIEIGRGHWPAECMPEVLASRDRSRAGPTALPQGLCLMWVEYPADDQLPAEPGAAGGSTQLK